MENTPNHINCRIMDTIMRNITINTCHGRGTAGM